MWCCLMMRWVSLYHFAMHTINLTTTELMLLKELLQADARLWQGMLEDVSPLHKLDILERIELRRGLLGNLQKTFMMSEPVMASV